MKSTRQIESTTKPKAISHAKRKVILFKEDQEKAFHGDGVAR
jgi:hypothetical protein